MEQPAPSPLLVLLELARRTRRAESTEELAFLAVNDTRELTPYRQAALWLGSQGVRCLSGLVEVDANVPYAQWLDRVCRLIAAEKGVRRIQADELVDAERAQWREWLPAYGLWLPLALPDNDAGGLLLARDLPWSDPDIALLGEWVDTWRHAWRARQRAPQTSWRYWRQKLAQQWRFERGARGWWKAPGWRWLLGILIVACLPVRLTVLAPGELVPAHPAVIRAPLDGVIAAFQVQPNDIVKKDQPLFSFDEALIQAKLAVAQQALGTAEAEYRQTLQQALGDARSKAQLALLTGKIEERRAEATFAQAQFSRASVLAPQSGLVLFDDPSEWIGRPVTVGERIMRIADPGDVEIEAWVPVADAIPLAAGASVTLYLNASPLAPVAARIRYLAHDAVQRPDGTYAYRLRATLLEKTDHRIGLKGNAKLQGRRVPLIYWVLRRPIATLRARLGW